MRAPLDSPASGRSGLWCAVIFFAVAFVFSVWAGTVGWGNGNLRGVEFRQAQTAISAYYIQQEHDFTLAYPTPVLGKPWSIPLEFPLFQWAAVALSNGTGVGLTQAARVVGLLSFYFTLPAVFLLLDWWKLRASHRWVILSLIVSCPLYVFYGRAFLIETMALLLSVWFLLGYLRWVQTAQWGWLLLAGVMGAGAGAVKVTTFVLYLVPAAAGTLSLLWENRPTAASPGWRRVGRMVGLSAAAVVVPLVLTAWWLHFTNLTRALNPSAQFMGSAQMNDYVFGTSQTRFAAAVWAGHWRIISQSVIWMPLAVIGGVGLLIFGRRWWARVLFCLGCFGGIQVVMPELYAWHDYYYVANTLFFQVVLGLAVISLFESRWPRWVGGVMAVGLVVGQGYFYVGHFYPVQSAMSPEGNDLSVALSQISKPEEVLLVQGEDWNSMIPYYSRRRALMLRTGVERNEAELRAAFAQLKGERVGVLVTRELLAPDALLIRLAGEYFGFNPRPMLTLPGYYLYIPEGRWDGLYDQLEQTPLHEVRWAPVPYGGMFADPMAGKWYETKSLKHYQTVYFKAMHPQPSRFFCRFGPSLNEPAGEPRFGAHPITRLCFALPPGAHRLQTAAGISAGAYDNLSATEATDGVEITLSLLRPDLPAQVIYTRWLNPRDNPADRGTVPLSVNFDLPAGAELELAVTAGPAGLDLRDWAYLGALKID